MSASTGLRGWVRGAFTEHLAIKFMALVASIGLFVIVRGTEDGQISMSVDVVALLPPPASARLLTSEIPDEVRVTLRGSRSVLNAVRREGMPPLQMDLSDASAHFYYFEQEALELPAGASIVQIAPAAIPLTWVDRADGRREIEPTVEGELAPGHVVTGLSVEPQSVLIRGAATEVNRLEQVRSQAVDLSGLQAGSHERRVPLFALPDHVSYVDTVSVVVTVVVEEETGSRDFDDLEVAVLGNADVTVRPTQVRVQVSGARRRLDELRSERVVPFVDVSEIDPALGAQPVAVQIRPLPEGLNAVSEPAEVLVVPPRAPPAPRP